MSIDTNDTGTIDLLDKATDDAALEISNLRQQLDKALQDLSNTRADLERIQKNTRPLEALANAIGDLPAIASLWTELESKKDPVSMDDIIMELEQTDLIDSAVERVLEYRSADRDYVEIASTVADLLTVEIQIDDITVEASATVSVD